MKYENSSSKTRQANPASELVLYAHRGSMVLAPENTMTAFRLALDYGADIMEIDVRLSRDNQVVVTHDERVDRTCNAGGRVRDMTLVQLQSLDAGYHFTDLDGRAHRNTGVTLPSLAEMFEQLPDVHINIDIKDNSEEAALAVANVIEKYDRHASVNVGSFHAPALLHFRAMLPTVTTAATQSEVAQLYFGRNLYRLPPFEYLQIPQNYYGIPLATNNFIRHAMKRDIKTVYWTINKPQDMQRLIELGVSGFVTDRVDIAGPLLGKQPHRSTYE